MAPAARGRRRLRLAGSLRPAAAGAHAPRPPRRSHLLRGCVRGRKARARPGLGLSVEVRADIVAPPVKIGVPREIKSDEYRIALTPAGARELLQRGHDVLVEAGAGEGSAFTDAAYEAVGARVAGSAEEVWTDSELILKVKEPIPSE